MKAHINITSDWQVISAGKRCAVIPAGKPEASAMEGPLDTGFSPFSRG